MKNCILFFVVISFLFVGCGPTYIVERTTTIYPDGKKVIVEKPAIAKNKKHNHCYQQYDPYYPSYYSPTSWGRGYVRPY